MKKEIILGFFVFTGTLSFALGGEGVRNKSEKTYKSVKIGNQEWMVENLNVNIFRNGDPVPEAKSDEEWVKAGKEGKPAWCYYENDPANGNTFGRLYNWYAVNDPRGLAPEGWHIPADDEWTTLTEKLGGISEAGGKLKETNTVYWISPNIGSTNETGFTALPGGSRYYNGNFNGIGYYGGWWSTTVYGADRTWLRGLGYGHSGVFRSISYKKDGMSVRCLRD